MDATVVYWTGAWLNFTVLFACVLHAVRRVRRGDVQAHRRAMSVAAGLVLLFLLSYVLKLAVLGREDLGLWSAGHLWNLRFHETCVLVMVLAGGISLVLGRIMRGTRSVTREKSDPVTPPRLARVHRVAGRTAAVGAGLGWGTAAIVLYGMWSRSLG